MKKVLTICLIAMFTSVWSFTYAQNPHHGRRGNRTMDPKQQIERLSDKLYLTDAQKKEFESINNEFFTKMRAERNTNRSDREKMRESMQALLNERDARIKSLLTAEQYKQYVANEEQMRNNRDRKNVNYNDRRNNNRGNNNSNNNGECPCW